MRLLRACIAAFVGLAILSVASPASAQIEGVSIDAAQVSREGTLTVPVTSACDVGFNLAFVNVTVAQSSGHKLARGAGALINNYPGVPCTGNPETHMISVPSDTAFAFKQGKAEVSASVTVFSPTTFFLGTSSVGPTEIRIGNRG